jgi:hypothetical protein
MKIQNIIKGEVVLDSYELEKTLNLSDNDNCMINVNAVFHGDAAEHAGYQLPVVMMSVKMARIDGTNLMDFIDRLGYVDACGKSSIPLPNGIEDLVGLYHKMKAWVDKGWELETDLTHMESKDFRDWVEFKVVQEVLRDVRELREAIKKQLQEQLPEAAKELE